MNKLVKRACTESVAVKLYIDSVIAHDNGRFSKEEAERIVYNVLVSELNAFYEMGGRPGELSLVITSKIVSPSVDVVDFIAAMRFTSCLLRVVAGYAGYSNIPISVPNKKLSVEDFRSLASNNPTHTVDSSRLNYDLRCLIGIHHDFDGEFELYNIIDMVKTRLGPIFDNRYLHFVYERDLAGRNGHFPNYSRSSSRESDHVNKRSWNDVGDKWTSDSAEEINQTRMEKVNPTDKEHENVQSEKPTLTDSPVGTATKDGNTAKPASNPTKAQATAFGIGGAQGAKINGNVSCEYHIDSLEVYGHGKKLKIKGLNGKLTANVDTLVEVLGALGIKE